LQTTVKCGPERDLVLVWVAALEPPGWVGHFSWFSMLAKANYDVKVNKFSWI